jgi:hypothetical protein
MALAAMPAPPIPSSLGLDGSWILGLSMAHGEGLVHGRDIIWTLGPMGYLSMPDPSDPFSASKWQVWVYQVGLYLLWAGVLFLLARSARNPAPVWSVLLLGLVAIADVRSPDRLEGAFFTVAALSFLDDSYRWLELVILAFLAAVGLMVKVNLGVEFAAVFVCLLLFPFRDSLPARTRIAILASLPVFAFALYWIFSGTPWTFAAYLRYSWEIAAGYSRSMAVIGPAWQAAVTILSVVLLFLVLPFLASNIREVGAAYATAAAGAFFVFKAGMVRQDAHAATVEAKLALVSVFFLVTAKTLRYRHALRAVQIGCLLMSFAWISVFWDQVGLYTVRQLLLLQAGPSISGFLRWPDTWNALKEASQTSLAKAQLDSSFGDAIGRGTVDALPWDVGQVKANHWTWRPRPVFQSYAAYTPALDRLNAGYMEGPQAPDFLLMSWMDIDGRHPFFTDPLSWRALLGHYRSGLTDGSTLLMRRVPAPRFDILEPVGSSTTHWNVDIPVPQEQAPLLLRAGVRENWHGTIRSLLFRLAPVWIDVIRRSGGTHRYRAVPDNLASGVIVAPFPEDLADLNMLGQPGCVPQQDPVATLRLVTNGPQEFHGDIPLQWFHLATGNNNEKPGPCAVVGISRREFPSWGGIADLTLMNGNGSPEALRLQGVAPWMTTTPAGSGHVVLKAAANAGPEPRLSGISVGGYPTTIVQAGTPEEAVSHLIQLGVFGTGAHEFVPPVEAVRAPVTILHDRIKDFDAPEQGQAVMGDWDGTGVVRLGIFKDGHWYLDLNNNRKWDGVEGGDGLYKFGSPGDFATVGDWVGDGITRLGVFRKGEWVLDVNNNRRSDSADVFCRFGLTGDIPVVGKWAPGSKADQIGVYRNGTWIVDNFAARVYRQSDLSFQFGIPGDLPVVSRSRSRVGVYRNGTWILDVRGSRQFDRKATSVVYGAPGDRPLIADW